MGVTSSLVFANIGAAYGTAKSEDTSHNDGDDVTHDQIRLHHAHGCNADPGLGGAVGGSNVGEDQRRRDAHEPKEWGGRRAVLGGQEGGQHGSKINGTPSLHSTLSV